MNPLLYLIGRTIREGIPTGHRADPRQFLLRYSAQSALKGQFDAAASLFSLSTQASNPPLTETLTLAALHLHASNQTNAIKLFDHALSQLNASDESPTDAPTTPRFEPSRTSDSILPSLESMIDNADRNLREGRYLRATRLFQTARNTLELHLSTHAGKLIAGSTNITPPTGDACNPLISLAKLDDLLLRMLARTHLAANVAVGLRERSLRDDLAPWATNNKNVQSLLQAEFHSLKSISRAHPTHSENNYRLGLVARATNDLNEAALAFQRVLNINPHHTPSATRLAATLLQLKHPEQILQLLTSSILVPSETLARYHALASIAEEQNSNALNAESNSLFARALDSLRENFNDRQTPSVTRANLAFALAEMNLLSEERSAWREAAAMAPSTLS